VLLKHAAFDPRVITVVNASGLTAANLVLTGSGFSVPLPDLAHGDSVTRIVYPAGDSGLVISNRSEIETATLDGLGYLQPHGGCVFDLRLLPGGQIERQTTPGIS
jgi:hypothetical protein